MADAASWKNTWKTSPPSERQDPRTSSATDKYALALYVSTEAVLPRPETLRGPELADVPMTLVNPDHFDQIMHGLAAEPVPDMNTGGAWRNSFRHKTCSGHHCQSGDSGGGNEVTGNPQQGQKHSPAFSVPKGALWFRHPQ